MKQYGLNEEFARGLAYSADAELFEELAKKYGNPTLVARTIHGKMAIATEITIQTMSFLFAVSSDIAMEYFFERIR